MPMYYDFASDFTTNGTTQTESSHLLFLTGSALTAKITAMYISGRHNAAGGGIAMLVTCGTAGSGGGAVTEQKKNPGFPAAVTVVTTTPTAGTTRAIHQHAGFAQTGGQGGWCAMEPDDALHLQAGGGANGNAEMSSKAIGTSVPITLTGCWQEN